MMEPMECSTNGDAILESEDMKKLFVSKIPLDASDGDIQSFFESICGGSVSAMSIIRKKDAKTYHFGFLTFDCSKSVDETIYKEKELVINGTTLQVNRACPKQSYQTGAHHKTKKLFIGGVPKSGMTEEDLKKYFDSQHDAKYGTIESIQLIKVKDDAGQPTEENKGFGFITVSSEHLADTMSIQHATCELNGNKLNVKKSDKDGKAGGGGRGGRGGGRGGAQYYGGGGYGGYGGYGYDWGGYGGYGYGGSYGMYPQYGVSSAVSRGRGGKRGGGGASGGRGGARGGKRFTPYAKET